MTPPDDRITLFWILRLRWLTAVCQTAAVLISMRLFPDALAAGPLFGLVALGAGSNGWLWWRLRQPKPVSTALPGLVLGLDILLLTALLYGSGGPANPFTAIYLVHITLATVVMRGAWAWALGLLSTAGYGLLFFWNVHVHALGHMDHGEGGMSLHLVGMWVAFVITASLIALFVGRVTRALRERDEEVGRLRDLAARQARLAALTTLAAGVAHELGSPLGTIAVAAKELHRAAGRQEPDLDSIREDADLIRQEVTRCRRILDQMAGPSAAALGEAFQTPSWAELEVALREDLDLDEQRRLHFQWPSSPPAPVALKGLVRALRALIANGLDATCQKGEVQVCALAVERGWHLEVRDGGTGMESDVLAQAGEPFFTTKSQEAGMGLGLFLARTFAEQLGGTMTLESSPGQGTTVKLIWPGVGGA